eukprot:m.1101026 g.1101026  ORF g.1101026 m.1101026 type:complete len:130 (-) comp24322_c0_seq6:3052-3441(-)
MLQPPICPEPSNHGCHGVTSSFLIAMEASHRVDARVGTTPSTSPLYTSTACPRASNAAYNGTTDTRVSAHEYASLSAWEQAVHRPVMSSATVSIAVASHSHSHDRISCVTELQTGCTTTTRHITHMPTE